MKVVVTGADGFIGRNLAVALAERPDCEVLPLVRESDAAAVAAALAAADAVIHLAAVNRPRDPAEFTAGNVDFTARLCDALRATGRAIPVAFASSAQATHETPYGASKRAAEDVLTRHAAATGALLAVYRLPNVFGKWGRPNYNSVVATFCHNLARGLPIRIDDPAAALRLVHVDDVVAEFLRFLADPASRAGLATVTPEYATTVGELARQIEAFGEVRRTLVTERVGEGFLRALYATYVSYLPPEAFSYPVPRHGDGRGLFAEVLKTRDSGQFSFFTAHPGVTRGGHYHHSKTEKFLVVQGRARFRFRHLVTGETHELETEGGTPEIVESIPGWAHDVTNVGDGEMVVMLWANEIFDRARPDTIAAKVMA
jgi:UDP-2-acetamido-2,6-beta-L-arabino-hexul-4-ose reductase